MASSRTRRSSGSGSAFDVAVVLEVVEGADDPCLVGADRCGQRGLGTHRRPVQCRQDDVAPHRHAVRFENRLLRGDELTQKRRKHRGQVGAPRIRRLRCHRVMIGIALSYACAYYLCMPTNSLPTFPLHRTAVLKSIDVVDSVGLTDLDRMTPCEGWNLADLVAHMTVQHRGFAAAARGFGADPGVWRVETVVDAVRADPRRAYSEAAHDALDAFAADGTADAPFALPEFGEGAVFPGAMAMGFHFVDYVVHGWDVADLAGCPVRTTRRCHRGRAGFGTCGARRRLSQHGRCAVRARRRAGRHRRLRADTATSRPQAGLAVSSRTSGADRTERCT